MEDKYIAKREKGKHITSTERTNWEFCIKTL